MDLQLGAGMDGVTATRHLSSGGGEDFGAPGPRVLVLTMFDTDADITRAIEAGATGYLLKAERPEELFAAIRNAASGRTALSAPVVDRVPAQLRRPRPALSSVSATSSSSWRADWATDEQGAGDLPARPRSRPIWDGSTASWAWRPGPRPWRSPRRSGCCPDTGPARSAPGRTGSRR
jgi:DNA-binding response OmpR family regulator